MAARQGEIPNDYMARANGPAVAAPARGRRGALLGVVEREMSYVYDRYETNPLHAHEREEARDARRYASPFASCYQHDYRSDGRGGGICIDCGDEIGADEL